MNQADQARITVCGSSDTKFPIGSSADIDAHFLPCGTLFK